MPESASAQGRPASVPPKNLRWKMTESGRQPKLRGNPTQHQKTSLRSRKQKLTDIVNVSTLKAPGKLLQNMMPANNY